MLSALLDRQDPQELQDHLVLLAQLAPADLKAHLSSAPLDRLALKVLLAPVGRKELELQDLLDLLVRRAPAVRQALKELE